MDGFSLPLIDPSVLPYEIHLGDAFKWMAEKSPILYTRSSLIRPTA